MERTYAIRGHGLRFLFAVAENPKEGKKHRESTSGRNMGLHGIDCGKEDCAGLTFRKIARNATADGEP